MRYRAIIVGLTLASLVGLAEVAPPGFGSAAAQAAERAVTPFDRGFPAYQRYCQSCHGEWGKGDGRVAKWLKVPPTDLTRISESNAGEFPAERLARVIDGREEVRAHGSREMPIWGKVFAEDVEGAEVEAVVGERVFELVEVLRWLDGRVGESPE